MGYRGGRFSGVSFTAERQLEDWGAPYRRTSTSPSPWREPSATIIHGALATAGREQDVVLWNSVPAHPHPSGRPLANRPPRVGEVAAGLVYVDRLLDWLRPELVVAVGRVAERLLGARATATVRHPAQGGATACRTGLLALLA
jgi:uracil-DNA glycosylase